MHQKYAEQFPEYERPILESPANTIHFSLKGIRGRRGYQEAKKALEYTINTHPLSLIETLAIEDSFLTPQQLQNIQQQARSHNQWLAFIRQDPCFRIQREGDKFILYKTPSPVEIATQRHHKARSYKSQLN